MHHLFLVFLFLISQIFTFSSLPKANDPLFTAEQMEEVDEIIKKTKAKKVKAVDSKNVFKQNCSSCHGRKGGLGLAGAANLRTSEMPFNQRVAMIYFGRNTMESYKSKLKLEEIIALAEYLETLRK